MIANVARKEKNLKLYPKEQTERGDITIIPAQVNNWAIWEKEYHFIWSKT